MPPLLEEQPVEFAEISSGSSARPIPVSFVPKSRPVGSPTEDIVESVISELKVLSEKHRAGSFTATDPPAQSMECKFLRFGANQPTRHMIGSKFTMEWSARILRDPDFVKELGLCAMRGMVSSHASVHELAFVLYSAAPLPAERTPYTPLGCLFFNCREKLQKKISDAISSCHHYGALITLDKQSCIPLIADPKNLHVQLKADYYQVGPSKGLADVFESCLPILNDQATGSDLRERRRAILKCFWQFNENRLREILLKLKSEPYNNPNSEGNGPSVGVHTSNFDRVILRRACEIRESFATETDGSPRDIGSKDKRFESMDRAVAGARMFYRNLIAATESGGVRPYDSQQGDCLDKAENCKHPGWLVTPEIGVAADGQVTIAWDTTGAIIRATFFGDRKVYFSVWPHDNDIERSVFDYEELTPTGIPDRIGNEFQGALSEAPVSPAPVA